MKKCISFIIALLVCLSLCGCVEKVEKIEPGQMLAEENSGLNIANPIEEMDRGSLAEKSGVDLGEPEGAVNLVYSCINLVDSNPIAQLRFELDGQNYCLRAQVVTGTNAKDISGLYYQWETKENHFVDEQYGMIQMAGDVGYIKWLDLANGVQYSLSMSAGADAELLKQTAALSFEAIQKES